MKKKPEFIYSPQAVLAPVPGCSWADKMVLNPAIIRDPDQPRLLHMLFRATGPMEERRREGQPPPYPISIGYAVSLDGGESWEADFSRPALGPALAGELENIVITDVHGARVLNHANGCIEDPRLFYFEDELYLSTACRMFAPGPYWVKDDPMQCAPDWAQNADPALAGLAVAANTTVSVLFKVDLFRLAARDYEQAFSYVGPLHDPERGDNRDVFLFPRRIMVDGHPRILCLHRPKNPEYYQEGQGESRPSIFLAAADNLAELTTDRAHQTVLARGVFDWERDRIGASWPPLEIAPGEWLLPYHGKKDEITGYTQSFMILAEQPHGVPRIKHRCSERLMYASQPWELNGDFTTPCLFTCGGVIADNRLIMSYGAADTRAGIASVDFQALIEYLRQFDADGNIIH